MRNRDAREKSQESCFCSGTWVVGGGLGHAIIIIAFRPFLFLTPPGFLIPPPPLPPPPNIVCTHTKQYRCHDGKLSCLLFSNMLAPADLLFLSNFTFDFHRCHRYHTGSWWTSPRREPSTIDDVGFVLFTCICSPSNYTPSILIFVTANFTCLSVIFGRGIKRWARVTGSCFVWEIV